MLSPAWKIPPPEVFSLEPDRVIVALLRATKGGVFVARCQQLRARKPPLGENGPA